MTSSKKLNFLAKCFIKSISIYPSTEEQTLRVYIGLESEDDKDKKYSVLAFFQEKNEIWQDSQNEKFTLEKTFEAMNEKIAVVSQISQSAMSENLFEGKLIFEE